MKIISRIRKTIFHRKAREPVVVAPKQYPLLTVELLDRLLEKLSYRLGSPEDFEFINHYLTSLGHTDYLLRQLRDLGIPRFKYIEGLFDTFNPTAGKVTARILKCILYLRRRVAAGEKIY